MDKYHASKADPFIILILMCIPVFGFVFASMALLMGHTLLGVLYFVLLVFFPAWMTLSTSYLIQGEYLKVRCGPYRYKLKIETIQSVEAVKTLKPGAALSFDKLKITYRHGRQGQQRAVYISPADKYTFVYDLGLGGEERFDTLPSDTESE